ncbi:MAG TPA: hypothetical protein VGN64_06195 [Dyadobacter sp.]|nr:hypothetical protein [Dyadobacter sp.]
MANRDWEAEHFSNIEEYVRQIRLLYYAAIREAARMGTSVKFDKKKPFEFSRYPALNSRVKEIFGTLSGKMLKTLNDASQHEWLLSGAKNDELVRSVLPTTKLKEDAFSGYFNRNIEALKEFQTRKSAGMNLSERIWKQTDQFKQELEMALDVGLLEGRSADQISRDIRLYLDEPEMLFRRVRDKRGILQLSKNALAYSPGQGVYRSSYKNAQRLARTEINMSYRAADQERWLQLDFVVGFRIRRSNNPYPCKLCDSMVGDYPKTYIWRGNHPNCRCVKTSILATKKEISDLTDQILNGDDTADFQSINEIKQMPAGFVSWIKDNKQRLLSSRNQPYFVRDNFKGGTVAGGLSLGIRKSGLTKTDIKRNVSFEMTDDVLAFLQTQRGFQTHGDASNYNTLIKGFDLVTLDSELNEIAQEKGFDWSRKDLFIDKGRVSFTYVGALNSREIYLSRSFAMQGGALTVNHDYFEIPKSLQGSGMSKQVFRRLYRQYQNAGVRKIKVHANIDIGGYSWARYGFGMTDKREVQNLFDTAKKKLSDRQFVRFMKIYNKYKDVVPFPIKQIATENYGKNLLLGSDWQGEIDLDDVIDRKYFEDYLFGKR